MEAKVLNKKMTEYLINNSTTARTLLMIKAANEDLIRIYKRIYKNNLKDKEKGVIEGLTFANTLINNNLILLAENLGKGGFKDVKYFRELGIGRS